MSDSSNSNNGEQSLDPEIYKQNKNPRNSFIVNEEHKALQVPDKKI